jgi:hypothetical protein
MYTIIIPAIIFISVIILYVININKKYIIKNNKENIDDTIYITEKNYNGFDIVNKFDAEEHISDAINTIFTDIKNSQDEWTIDVNYDEITIKKRKLSENYAIGKINIKIIYVETNFFSIKSIELSTSIKSYRLKKLKKEHYELIYNIYKRNIEMKNQANKDLADKSLEEIYDLIGKDTLRDIKIDNLLNDED